MRPVLAIVRTTALEILSEPLSLLLLLAALVLAILAPAFHYHQFGEATRMARDAGFSALFTCGGALAVFGTLRAFRREIESGTLEMALAHPVSRSGFFLSKTLGAFAAYLVFAAIVSSVALTVVNGAAIGGRVAQRSGDVARLWGPSFALALAALVLPSVVAAVLSRFARFRFVPSVFVLTVPVSLVGLAYRPDLSLYLRLLPPLVTLVLLALVLLAAAAAASIRWKANGAASAVGVVVALLAPFFGNYYLSDALAKGGSVAWSYVGWASLATLPAVSGLLLAGALFFTQADNGHE